jgi:(p)ppGpp synthase/HD superfamily hydrolase
MNHEIMKKAIVFAVAKHQGQTDDIGKRYFDSHIQPVANALMTFTNDAEIIAAAYLHDTLEDTNTTYDELVNEFGVRVADLVNELTHEGEKDHYYFPRLKSKEAILIKLIDRASNISRMENWNDNKKDKYLKKTRFWKDGTNKQEE